MNIAFTAWLIIYPVATDACKYMLAARVKMEGKPPITDGAWGISAIVDIVVWVYVATLLWQPAY